ncbi:SemiSWEET transporter [Candidatus Woesearchaeota archaeon]|nr:SemiSWEET transporter [Candidatus Woesearchaeota archaeon]
MDFVLIIGYIAAVLTTVAFLPQAIRILRLKETKDISLLTYICFSAGVFSWLVYGMFKNDWPIIAANFVTFILAFTILVLKLKYK